jgi:hypothetical protein
LDVSGRPTALWAPTLWGGDRSPTDRDSRRL